MAFVDQRPDPQRTVLVGEANERSVGRGTRRPTGFGQQQQSQQALGLAFVGHQFDQQPCQADGLVAQVVANQRLASGGDVALVEDEVDHSEHRPHPVW